MPGMDMGSKASPKKSNSNAPARDPMGDMDMPSTKPRGQTRPAPRPSTTQAMPKGMDMSRPAKSMPMEAMPGMADMPGMNKPPEGAKKPAKAKSGGEGMSNMGNMADMPGMKAPAPKQSMPSMDNMKGMPGTDKAQAMPAMGTMPGMSMPANPMDKFRFEDNNPARNKPKTDKQ